MNKRTLHEIGSSLFLMEATASTYWQQALSRILNGETTFTDERKAQSSVVRNDPRAATNRNGSGAYEELYRLNLNGQLDPKGAIQVVDLNGPIMKADLCGAAGTDTLRHAIAYAMQDDSIQAIILNIDSPGGSVTGTEELAATLTQRSKPVISYVSGMMASAAYWIGSQSDKIVSAPNSANLIGSIGTMARFVDISKAQEAMGVTVHEVYATSSTHKNKDYRDVMSGNYDDFRVKRLDVINNSFHQSVRNARPNIKEEALTGEVYDNAHAKKLGMIDQEGTFADAIKAATKIINQQKSIKMTPFKNALAAAKADEFAVVEGGFLLTEQQLQELEAHITNDSATIRTQNGRIAQLEAEAQQVDPNTGQLADQLTEQLTALQSELEELKAQQANPLVSTSGNSQPVEDAKPKSKLAQMHANMCA